MNSAILVLAGVTLAIWVYLISARGRYWRTDDRLGQPAEEGFDPPTVTAIVPARNEYGTIGAAVCSLLTQKYPGKFDVIVVDDGSSDGTADVARAAARKCAGSERLTVVAGKPLPPGWAGKPWALQQGIDRAVARSPAPDYLLLTDADIVHAPHVLSALAGRAAAGDLVLVSVMAALRCRSVAERFAVPAFVYFFKMLYPFSWVADEAHATAAAAGGCVLARARELESVEGFRRIRDALIDDCALARLMKPRGRIWLGLSRDVTSLRPYDDLAAIGRMVIRSAYTELRYSPLRLLAAIAGMAITFLAPPLLLILASGPAAYAGVIAWALMTASFLPMLRFYRLSPLWAFLLPAVALVYMSWTIRSAIEHATGRGGRWKGRSQAGLGGAQ